MRIHVHSEVPAGSTSGSSSGNFQTLSSHIADSDVLLPMETDENLLGQGGQAGLSPCVESFRKEDDDDHEHEDDYQVEPPRKRQLLDGKGILRSRCQLSLQTRVAC